MPPLINLAAAREHIETGLVDAALQRLIDDAEASVADRFGPHASNGTVTEDHPGYVPLVFPRRQVGAVTRIVENTGSPRTVLDGAITATFTALTSATAAFVSGDVGKYIEVNGAGVAGATLQTTIAAYVSPTEVTLAAAATTTVAGAVVIYGGTVLTAADYLLELGGRQIRRIYSRGTWGERIRLVYTPANDDTRRKRVIVDLVRLAVRYEGVKSQIDGDHSEVQMDDYQEARDRVMDELAPAYSFA